MNNKILLLLCLSVLCVNAQTGWKKADKTIFARTSGDELKEDHYEVMEMNFASFLNSIKGVSKRGAVTTKKTIVELPNEKGEVKKYEVFEAPVFSPSLSKKYPNIKSFVGKSADGDILRMSVGSKGVQTMIFRREKPVVFMEPVDKSSNEKYIVYNRGYKNVKHDFTCSTEEHHVALDGDDLYAKGVNDQILKKFRLAISVNGEYTKYHGGTVEKALEAINATVTRVNGVYERDLGVTFELVDAPQLIFTDPEKDPYTKLTGIDVPREWNYELQNTLTESLGNEKYDIGHMFGSDGGGGNAGCIACVCRDDDPKKKNDLNKGAGITSPADGKPEGSNFDIDYVCHEIGHQMGANHTFSMRNEGFGVSYEPGSGSTIMGYAGISRGNDLQEHTDPFFHQGSIRQIFNYITSKGKCWESNGSSKIENTPAVVDAGKDYFIPKATAFWLKGKAIDPEKNQNLTYSWEQIDNGNVNFLTFGGGKTRGAIARSLPPKKVPYRSIPKLSSVVAGKLTEIQPTKESDWESVSYVPRDLNWALTVRDVDVIDGKIHSQTTYDTKTINVTDAGPFEVSTVPTLGRGTEFGLTWLVRGTDEGKINCKSVNIKLSVDGGKTFPILLAEEVANDGKEKILIPADLDKTEEAYIMVEAAHNIFYAVSNKFGLDEVPDFAISSSLSTLQTCNDKEKEIIINYVPVNGFTEEVTFNAIDKPKGSTVTFIPNTIKEAGRVKVIISDLDKVRSDKYELYIEAKGGDKSKKIKTELDIISGGCKTFGARYVATGISEVKFNTIENKTSPSDDYKDYKNTHNTTVVKGKEYSLSVEVKATYPGETNLETKAWIDWNMNCSFEDEGEEYYLGGFLDETGGAGNPSKSPIKIRVPDNAKLGMVVMRISTKYGGKQKFQPSPCEVEFQGEAEDYGLIVKGNDDVLRREIIEKEDAIEKLTVYPNPSTGMVNISFKKEEIENAVSLKLVDLSGKIVYTQSFNKQKAYFNEQVSFKHVQKGIYLLQIQNGKKMSLQKIVLY